MKVKIKGKVDILANFPIDTSLKKKTHSVLGRLAFDDDGYSDIEMVLVEEVAKDVNVHCGACALGGISLLVGIKSVYVVTNPRYASVSSTSVSLSQHDLMLTYFSEKLGFQNFLHTNKTLIR